MLLALVRQFVAVAMLMVASTGSLPLWLHHMGNSCGSAECSMTPASESVDHCFDTVCSRETACGETSYQRPSPIEPAWDESKDDCAVCFQLSQSTLHPSVTLPICSERLLACYLTLDSQIPPVRLLGLHVTRGPPHVLSTAAWA